MLAFIAFILLLEFEANGFLWFFFAIAFFLHYSWRVIKYLEKRP